VKEIAMQSLRRTVFAVLILGSLAASLRAADMERYFRKDDSGRPRWYIPPADGPLAGSQNFWFVTPHDVLPGGFNMGGKIVNAQAESFQITPNCVWGQYTYRVTRLAQEQGVASTLHQRPNISTRELLFSDLAKVADRTVLINGTITEVLAGAKGFQADVEFAGGPLPLRFDLVKTENEKRLPEVHSRHYGPHWHQTFDVYYPDGFRPETGKALPVLLNIHGGGWGALDKGPYDATSWNEAGIAVISINYRFVSEFDQHPPMTIPVAAPLLDAARAIQYIKFHAKELGIDPARICLTGGSAGGASSCWLAMHDDLAAPQSSDPIARVSTRVACAAPVQAQTSLDPRQMREWIPQITYGAHAFFTREQMKDIKGGKEDNGERFEFFLQHRDEILPYIKDFSAYEQASADDPPILHIYGGQRDVIPAIDASNATHHPKFGEHLHKRLKELGVESYYWADDVPCENPRYHGWPGVKNFVQDKLLGPGWEQRQQ